MHKCIDAPQPNPVYDECISIAGWFLSKRVEDPPFSGITEKWVVGEANVIARDILLRHRLQLVVVPEDRGVDTNAAS
jgi:hypothetical protein